MKIYKAMTKKDEYGMMMAIMTFLMDRRLYKLVGDLEDYDSLYAAMICVMKILDLDKEQMEDKTRVLIHKMVINGVGREENLGKITDIIDKACTAGEENGI